MKLRTAVRRIGPAVALALGLTLGTSTALAASNVPSETVTAAATVPPPTTAAGYTAMFAALDTNEWGAADTSLSVPLADGRSVWMFSDTLRGRGFVHSTAITQRGGELHVSNGGAQVIPNDSATSIYWIEQARAVSATDIQVTTAPMVIGSGGVWDFHRRTVKSRLALVRVDAAGDVRFVRWLRYVAQPKQYDDFTVVGPHHYTYENRPHPELRLASGKVLWTVNQNWDDGLANHRNADGSLRYADYRPIFSER